MAALLSRERIVARPGFNRWLVPPAALAIHLSIGMAYGFSVFWLPLSRADRHHRAAIALCPDGHELLRSGSSPAPATGRSATLGWMYTLFFVFLGSSAAVFGRWLERAGPRKAGVVAAFCWGSGFMISALGIYLHQIWLMWLGSGVIGGMRAGTGLHLARVHAHQVVPRPPRHGNRHGHHGVRRRGDDRVAAGRPADEGIRDADLGRRLGDVRHDGRDLLRRDAVRRVRLPGAAGRTGQLPDWRPATARSPPSMPRCGAG